MLACVWLGVRVAEHPENSALMREDAHANSGEAGRFSPEWGPNLPTLGELCRIRTTIGRDRADSGRNRVGPNLAQPHIGPTSLVIGQTWPESTKLMPILIWAELDR